MTFFKRLRVLGVVGLSTLSATVGSAGIWDQTRQNIEGQASLSTYERIVAELPLLTDESNVVAHSDGTYIIGGGYIVLSREALRSYQSIEDYGNGEAPEFEFLFSSVPSTIRFSSHREGLNGIRVALDMIPSHPFFKESVGNLEYEQFVEKLQSSLREMLSRKGAEVSLLRPVIQFSPETVAEINENVPDLVISTQFNNDEHDGMVVFTSGNHLEDEFSGDRLRARFVQAALTGKAIHSLQLGAEVIKSCQKKIQVQLLPKDLSSFEGKAKPVSSDFDAQVGTTEGLATRNLMHNGIFAKAVVVPFPSMGWVRTQVADGKEAEWTERYSSAIAEAIEAFVASHPALFSEPSGLL